MLAKKFAVGFGVAVLLPMVIHYGVSTFSKEPRWENYYTRHSNYAAQNATLEEKARLQKEDQQREERYQATSKVFAQHLFFVTVPIGIAAIIIGASLAFQAVGAGLIFGGIFALTDGYCHYWNYLQDWMRFLSLLAAFIVIVVVGYIKVANKSNK